MAKHVDGGDIKFLVESEGELLLVNIYDSHGFGFPGEDGLRLDVFTLNEKHKKWVKLTSLGNRILFLGNEYSFSTTASDLSIAKGNCVIFTCESNPSTILTICFVGCVFFTWINTDFPLCPIILITPTCSGHLLTGSLKCCSIHKKIIFPRRYDSCQKCSLS